DRRGIPACGPRPYDRAPRGDPRAFFTDTRRVRGASGFCLHRDAGKAAGCAKGGGGPEGCPPDTTPTAAGSAGGSEIARGTPAHDETGGLRRTLLKARACCWIAVCTFSTTYATRSFAQPTTADKALATRLYDD